MNTISFQDKVRTAWCLKKGIPLYRKGKKIAKAQEKGKTEEWLDENKDQVIPQYNLNSNLIVRMKDSETGEYLPYIWDSALGDWVMGYPLELNDVVVIGDASKVKQPEKTWAEKLHDRLSYTPYVLSAEDADKMNREVAKQTAFFAISALPLGWLGYLGGKFVIPAVERGLNLFGGKALQFGSKYVLPVVERGANWIGKKASQIATELATQHPWLVPAARGVATGAKAAWNYGARPAFDVMDYAFNPYRIMTLGDDLIKGQRWLAGTKLGLKYGVRPWKEGIITDVARGVGNVGTHLGSGYWGVEGAESLYNLQLNGWRNTSALDKVFLPFSVMMATAPVATGVRAVINPSAANLGALGLVTTGAASNIAAGGYKFNSTPVGQYIWLGPLRFGINQGWRNTNTSIDNNNTHNQN